jgi:hypothetical protein
MITPAGNTESRRQAKLEDAVKWACSYILQGKLNKITSKTVPGLLRYKRCKFSSKFTTVVNVVIVNFINFVKMVLNLVLNVVNLVL